MAFFNDLVRVIAEVQGLDEMTVRGIGLNVRDAGHIRKGGRGLSAAKMSPKDAASLLIGTCATNMSKQAGNAVGEFYYASFKNARGLSTKGRALLGRIMLDEVPAGDFLAELIQISAITRQNEFASFLADNFDFPQGGIDRNQIASEIDRSVYLEIHFSRPSPRIDFLVRGVEDRHIYSRMWFSKEARPNTSDRRETVMITHKTLRSIGSELE
ncbi:hypothetical protein ACLBYG_31380 [Methylobacterium sp. D53M]|jgi:hypothetical protein